MRLISLRGNALRVAVAMIAFLWLACIPGVARKGLAQDADAVPADEETAAEPFAVINVAGVERWLENVQCVFQTVQRPEVGDMAAGMLSRVNDLKGLDRARPFGLMFYLGAGLTPEAVGYLPVDGIDDLMQTLSIGPVVARKVDGEPGRYELVGPNRTFPVRLQGEYGFVADNAELLDRELPDPEELNRTLTDRYDLAVSINPDRIPPVTRELFLGLLRTSAEAQLQRRDDEPAGEYRIRRAGGLSNVQLLELLIEHGRRVTLGWDVSPEQKRAVLELAVEARPDSPLATHLQEIGSQPSQFAGLLDETAPWAMSVSWALDKPRKEMFVELLRAARDQMAQENGADDVEMPGEPDAASPVARVFERLITTAEQGHLDLFAQLSPTPQGKLALVGGLKVTDGAALAGPLSDFVLRLREADAFADVQTNADSHQGVSLHRLVPENVGRQEQRMYGENPALYVGAGPQTLWFAFGGSEATGALKGVIDRVTSPQPGRPQGAAYPFRMVVNVSPWSILSADDDRPRPGRELFRQAFTPENDMLRIDFRPTENGGRLRLEFDEGFLRLLGLSLARRYDESQL